MSTRKLSDRRPPQRERPHEVQVHLDQVRSPDAVDAEREDALLEVGRPLRRIALEPGVDIEPAIERRVVARDVVEVAVEEDVAPGEERARLVFERAGHLPAAEDRGQHAGAPELPAAAERDLGQAAGRDAVRAAVDVRLPQRRLAVELVQELQVADPVARVGRAQRVALVEPAREVDLDAVRRLLAERQVGEVDRRVLRVRSAQQALQLHRGVGEEGVAGHPRVERRVASPGARRSSTSRNGLGTFGLQEVLLRHVPDVAAVPVLLGQVVHAEGHRQPIADLVVVGDLDGRRAPQLALDAAAIPLHPRVLRDPGCRS